MSTFWADLTLWDKVLIQTVEEVSVPFLSSPVQMLLQTHHSLPWTDSNTSYSLGTGCAHVYVLSSFFSLFFYKPMSTSISLYARHYIGELHLWKCRNRVGFTGVCSLLQCRNKGSLAAHSNGLCLSCTDHKLLLFCLNCAPSKDLTRMHFGLYSIQSSFCTECSLAPRFWRWLNLNGTFVSELPLIVSQRSYSLDLREAGRWNRICHWKDEKYLFPEGHKRWINAYSDPLLQEWNQLDWKQFLSVIASFRTSLTNNTLMKVWVQFLRGPIAH